MVLWATTCVGFNTLLSSNGCDSVTCVGDNALAASISDSQSTAIGASSLAQSTSGNQNIAIGYQSGLNYTSSEEQNILIGNPGVVEKTKRSESGPRILMSLPNQNLCYIAGIAAASYSSLSKVPALVYMDTTNGQLVSAQALASNITTSGFGSLVVGTALQSSATYSILVNVSIVVTAATELQLSWELGQVRHQRQMR